MGQRSRKWQTTTNRIEGFKKKEKGNEDWESCVGMCLRVERGREQAHSKEINREYATREQEPRDEQQYIKRQETRTQETKRPRNQETTGTSQETQRQETKSQTTSDQDTQHKIEKILRDQ